VRTSPLSIFLSFRLVRMYSWYTCTVMSGSFSAFLSHGRLFFFFYAPKFHLFLRIAISVRIWSPCAACQVRTMPHISPGPGIRSLFPQLLFLSTPLTGPLTRVQFTRDNAEQQTHGPGFLLTSMALRPCEASFQPPRPQLLWCSPSLGLTCIPLNLKSPLS